MIPTLAFLVAAVIVGLPVAGWLTHRADQRHLRQRLGLPSRRAMRRAARLRRTTADATAPATKSAASSAPASLSMGRPA